MLPREFTIRDDFAPVSYEQWRALAEADLHGATIEQKLVTHTYEGIDIQPLYTRRDRPVAADPEGFPGAPPFVRGARPLGPVLTGWDLRQEHDNPDLEAAHQAVLQDLEGGVTSLLLCLDGAACHGWDPDQAEAIPLAGRRGVSVYQLDDLDALLADVDLDIAGVALDGGGAFFPAAALLAGLWRRRGCAEQSVWGAFNADPLGVLAREGALPYAVDTGLRMLTELAAWTSQQLPNVTAVGVDTSPYHHAGATAAQDVGLAMATAVEYLRAMTDPQQGKAALAIDSAARQILFRMSVGTHHFLSIAKLRSARRLWWRIIQMSGGSPAAAAMQLHVRTSKRVLTQRDPYVNLLRNTVAMFAAGIAGADTITSEPFDVMTSLPDDFSRRVARNTLLILQEEAHLHRVVDPAGGSWFLDHLTDDLAQAAWGVFQEVERQGGMLAALQSGWVANQIDAAYAPRAKDIARRKEGITGVSEFPDVGEQRVRQRPLDPVAVRAAAAARVTVARRDSATLPPIASLASAVEAAAQGATVGQLARALGFHAEAATIAPLELRSFAEPFEELRDASDAWQAAHGHRPRVFLANVGPVSHHIARGTYAKNFFEAGGFEVQNNDGFGDAQAAAAAFEKSNAPVVVICSSDKLYPHLVPELAPLLKAAGARSVVLAGNPGANEAAWRAAGVDRFIFVKCDVLATLRDLLREEGVLAS